MNIVLFDFPDAVEALKPFSYTRPLSHIRLGIFTIAEKWQHYLQGHYSCLAASHLAHKFPLTKADVNLCINSTICPDSVLVAQIEQLALNEKLMQGDTLIACCCDAAILEALPINGFDHPGLRMMQFEGTITQLQHPWDIFLHNDQALRSDFLQHSAGKVSANIEDPHTITYQKEDIFVEEGAKMQAAILNAQEGPIYIGKNVLIQPGAVIQGPVALCHHARISPGATIHGATTIGPYARVGGEVRNAVIFGYTNKSHEGFLGSSVLGEWCNIGAGTNVSNLRNNYGPVKVWSYPKFNFVPTALQFCGLLMGDHSKCAVNTAFNTGTVVGVSANVFKQEFSERFIPSFTWGNKAQQATFQLDKAFTTAARMMERRNVALTETDKEILTYVYHRSSIYRSQDRP